MMLRFVLEVPTRRDVDGPIMEVTRVTGPPIPAADVTIGELDALPRIEALLTKLLGREIHICQEG